MHPPSSVQTEYQPTLPSGRRAAWSSLARNLALTGTLALSLTAHSSRAAVIFDNLSTPVSPGAIAVLNTQHVAQAFTTTATDFVLTAVHLQLYLQMPGSMGTYELQLWDSGGPSGGPGAQVGTALYTGFAQNLSTTSNTLLSVTGLNRTLAANTTYYLVAAGKTLTGMFMPPPLPPMPGGLGWNTTSPSSAAFYSSNNSGTTWSSFSATGYMKIEAGPGGASVPDAASSPATLGLILAGLAGLRRRLRP